MFELDATETWTAAGLQAAADAHNPWFHSFAFSNGAHAWGRDPSHVKLAALQLPDLRGKSVIDVGAFDGYFSFHAERLGASRVVAADQVVWITERASLDRFRFVRDVLGSSVEELSVSVEDMAPGRVGTFDIVLFLGVLYHAKSMMHYLERMRSITGELMILETLVDRLEVEGPAAAFYPAGSVNGDPSNWWGPNLACVGEMLTRARFRRVEFKGIWHRNTLAELRGEDPNGSLTSGRAVWHAYV